ncbi:hypothetical protein vseg_010629 [Gypsophila vaccaria]
MFFVLYLKGPSWNINGYPLGFKAWSPTFSQELDTVSMMHVWVLFPNLDPYLWSAKALSKMASSIGRPICTYEHTTIKTKDSFARILIEVDVSKDLAKAITVTTPYGDKLTTPESVLEEGGFKHSKSKPVINS